MLTIGLLGGIAYASTLHYYKRLNELIGEQLGGLHSSKIIVYSLDLQEYADFAHAGNFTALKTLVCDGARALHRAGADVIVICSNTAHMAVEMITASLGLPVLHIGDVVATAVKASFAHDADTKKDNQGVAPVVGFIGTSFTMEGTFMLDKYRDHGLNVIVPTLAQTRNEMQQVIEKDLSHNRVTQRGKQVFLNAINGLRKRGAQAIILGCTEIGMVIKSTDVPDMKTFDSCVLHVQATVDVQTGLTKCAQYQPTTMDKDKKTSKKNKKSERFAAVKVVSLLLAGCALIWGLCCKARTPTPPVDEY